MHDPYCYSIEATYTRANELLQRKLILLLLSVKSKICVYYLGRLCCAYPATHAIKTGFPISSLLLASFGDTLLCITVSLYIFNTLTVHKRT